MMGMCTILFVCECPAFKECVIKEGGYKGSSRGNKKFEVDFHPYFELTLRKRNRRIV